MDKDDKPRGTPPTTTNAPTPTTTTATTGQSKITYPGKYSGFAHSHTAPSQPSKLSSGYTSVYLQTKDPFARSQKMSRSPPLLPTTDSSGSEVMSVTELERQMLDQAVSNAAAKQDQLIQAGPSTPKSPEKPEAIHVDTSVSRDIVEVDSDLEPEEESDPVRTEDDRFYDLLIQMDEVQLLFDTDFPRSQEILKLVMDYVTLDVLSSADRENVAFMREWLRPAFKYLSGDWQDIISFFDRHTPELLRTVAQLAAVCCSQEGLRLRLVLHESLRVFLGTFIHMHLHNITTYFDEHNLRYNEDFIKYLIYSGPDSFLLLPPMIDISKPYTDEDLISLQSVPSISPEELAQQLTLMERIISLVPTFHAQQTTDSTVRLSPLPQKENELDRPSTSQQPQARALTPTIVVQSPSHSPRATTVMHSPGSAVSWASQPPRRELPPIPTNISAPLHLHVDSYATDLLIKRDERAARLQYDATVNAAAASDSVPDPLSMVFEASTRMRATEIIDDDEFISQYGTDCVITVGVVDTSLNQAEDSQVCTILGVLSGIVKASYDGYAVTNTDALKARVVGTLISLPDVEPPYKQLFVNDSFPMTALKANNLQTFKIQATGAKALPTVISAPEYTINQSGMLDIKSVTGAIQTMVSGFSRQMAEGIANLALPNVSRHSMLSFFTRMFTIHLTLVSCEELGIEPHFADLVPNDITNVDISVVNAGLAEAVTTLSTAINAGRPILEVTELNVNSLHCMRLISAGTQAIRTPNHHTHELIGRKFVWEEDILWVVIGRTGTLPVSPPNINVTPAMMLDFIYLMARIYHRNDDMVNGFIRASLMLTGQLVTVRTKKEGVSSRWLNGMLEMHSTVLPASRADNVIWRLLKATRPETTCPSADNEVRFIAMQPAAYFGHLSTLVGFLISLGYSHVFHTLNITGTTMTAFARNTARAAVTDLLRGLVTTKDTEYIPLISRIACGYLPQISPMSFSPLALTSAAWSGYGLIAGAADPVHSWRRLYPTSIVYIGQPMSAFNCGLLLDSNWGLTQPGAKGNFRNEVTQYDNGKHLMWSAALGDPAYEAHAKSAIPYFYIPYGIMAINVLMQQCRCAIASSLRFIEFKRVNAVSVPIFGLLPVPWPEFNFQVIPELCMARVGTVPCYDWANDSIMVPALILGEQVDRMQALLETEPLTEFRRAGLRYAGVRTQTLLNTNVMDVLNVGKKSAPVPKEPTPKADPPAAPKIDPKPEVKSDPPKPVPTEAKVEAEVKKVADAVPATPVIDNKK